MPFATIDEQRELVATARQVLADAARLDPVPPTWGNRAAGLNQELWRSLADLGLLGVGIPEKRGGSGGGARELCLLAEQVGAVVPRIPFTGTAAVLAATRHDVTDIVDGSAVVVPAWETFPTAVVPRARTAALRLNGASVEGELRAVAFGLDADRLLAFAGSVPVIFDLDAPGVRRVSVDSFDITEPSASIELTGVTATVLEPVADVDRVLAVLAAELIGTGQRALDGAVEFAGQRHQFGRPIGSFQAIKHLLADRHVQLDAARLLVERAAAAIDDQQPDATAAAQTALVAASDAADAATRDALQVHGGIGFTWEHPSHVFLKRARARRSLLGSVETQLDALADHILAAH